MQQHADGRAYEAEVLAGTMLDSGTSREKAVPCKQIPDHKPCCRIVALLMATILVNPI